MAAAAGDELVASKKAASLNGEMAVILKYAGS
jgi:hypothetical protein